MIGNDSILHFSARIFPVVLPGKRNSPVVPTWRTAHRQQSHPEGVQQRTPVAALPEANTWTDASRNVYPTQQHSAKRHCISYPCPFALSVTFTMRSEHGSGPVICSLQLHKLFLGLTISSAVIAESTFASRQFATTHSKFSAL